jgi:hypothetical protein
MMNILTEQQKKQLEENIIRAIKELREHNPNAVIRLSDISRKSSKFFNLDFPLYDRHFDKALQRLRKRGVIVFHGTILGGKLKQTWDIVKKEEA